MLQRALHLHTQLQCLFCELSLHIMSNSTSDWATEKSCVGKYPTLSWIVLIYNSLLDDTEDVISSTEESSALHRAGVACKVKLMAHYNMSQVMLVSLQLSLILVSLYRPCLY